MSEEHIIPDSLGGRLKSKRLLCVSCNTNSLNNLDNELNRQLSAMISLTGAFSSKNRDKLYQAYTDKGEKIALLASGTIAPRIEIFSPRAKRPIVITKKDVPSLIEATEKKLNELCEGDTEKVKALMARITNDYTDRIIVHTNALDSEDLRNSELGGLMFYKAIAKIMVNYAVENGVEIDSLEGVIDYIKRSNEVEFKRKGIAYCRLFYPSYFLPYFPKEDEISHILHLKADGQSKKLIGYIELFNAVCCMVVLNWDYNGSSFFRTYRQNINSIGGYIEDDLFHKPSLFYTSQFGFPELPEKTEAEIESRYLRFQKVAISRLNNVEPVILNNPIIKSK